MTYNFIGHDNWRKTPPETTNTPIKPETKINVLRGILFFYAGQKTTLSRIRLHFTELAVSKLIHDKYIEIYD